MKRKAPASETHGSPKKKRRFTVAREQPSGSRAQKALAKEVLSSRKLVLDAEDWVKQWSHEGVLKMTKSGQEKMLARLNDKFTDDVEEMFESTPEHAELREKLRGLRSSVAACTNMASVLDASTTDGPAQLMTYLSEVRGAGIEVASDFVYSLGLSRALSCCLADGDYEGALEFIVGQGEKDALCLSNMSEDEVKVSTQNNLVSLLFTDLGNLKDDADGLKTFERVCSMLEAKKIFDEDFEQVLKHAGTLLRENGSAADQKAAIDGVQQKGSLLRNFFQKSCIGCALVARAEKRRSDLLGDAACKEELEKLQIPVKTTTSEITAAFPADFTGGGKLSFPRLKKWRDLSQELHSILAKASENFIPTYENVLEGVATALTEQFGVIVRAASAAVGNRAVPFLARMAADVKSLKTGKIPAHLSEQEPALFAEIGLPEPDTLHASAFKNHDSSAVEAAFDSEFSFWKGGQLLFPKLWKLFHEGFNKSEAALKLGSGVFFGISSRWDHSHGIFL